MASQSLRSRAPTQPVPTADTQPTPLHNSSPSVPYPFSLLSHPQRVTLLTLIFIVASGTLYSVIHNTATAPAASATELLGGNGGTSLPRSETPLVTSYFAKKGNIFNQMFAKQAWLWTTLVYLIHLTLTPPPTTTSTSRVQTKRSSVAKFFAATLFWTILTLWAIGPSIFERTMIWSGGECAVVVPRAACEVGAVDCSSFEKAVGIGKEALVKIPGGFCHGGAPKRFSWDDLVLYLTTTSEDTLGGAPGDVGVDQLNAFKLETIKDHFQNLRPHWSGGHDISGHVFLLTMSSMLIVDLVWPGFRRMLDGKMEGMGLGEKFATAFGVAVVTLWGFILSKTAMYFHTVLEKITGMTLAIIGSLLFQYVGSVVY